MSTAKHKVVVVGFDGAEREISASELGESAFVVVDGTRHAVKRVVETRLDEHQRRIDSFGDGGKLLASLVQRR